MGRDVAEGAGRRAERSEEGEVGKEGREKVVECVGVGANRPRNAV